MLAELVLPGASAATQLLASALALQVGRLTGRPGPWTLIAIAIAVMATRSGLTLYRVLSQPTFAPDRFTEATVFGISALMLAGLGWAGPIYRAQRLSGERARELDWILENSRNEIYVFDAETLRFVQVNRGARENLGYDMDELRQLTPLDLMPKYTPESFERLVAPLRRAERERVHFVTDHRRRDGSTYPAEADLQDSCMNGAPVFVAMIVDISERRRVEGGLQRLGMATEQAGEGICIVDRAGRIEYANPAFARMMQRSRQQIEGEPIDDLAFSEEDEALLEDMRSKLSRGEAWRGRYESVWPDGCRYVRNATLTPLRKDGGSIRGFVGVIRDVTREVELEQSLYLAQKMEAIGQLAGGVAHDFNNLLTVIAGYAEVLLRDSSETAREAALEVSRAAERAGALTRQLLTFSRKGRHEPRVIDLNERLRDMRRLLHRLLGEDVQLELRLHPDPVHIEADPAQIEQVVLNLAFNARDAMPEGGRLCIATQEVSVDPAAEEAPGEVLEGRHVVLAVTDSGVGMDAEVQRRVFEPFFTTKQQGKGTGLGLSTAYGVVHAAGGGIRVQSAPGRGATFQLYFPRVEGSPREIVEPMGSTTPAHARSASVLLVEDEPLLRKLARSVLVEAGYRVMTAADGEEALVAAREAGDAFDALVTDVVMPRMSGTELAARLRERVPDLKVVLTSGYPEREGRVELPAEVFLAKPFRPDDLLRAIGDALADRSTPPSPSA